MNDLVEFIRARLGEDTEHSRWLVEDWWPEVYEQATADAVCRFASHDRVHNAIEAKRRLVDAVLAWEHPLLYSGYDENHGPYPCTREGVECDPDVCGVVEKQRLVLGALAAEWATHEAYQESWKP